MRHLWHRFRQSGYHKTIIGTVLVMLYLFPVYWMVVTSFKSRGDIFAVPPKLLPIPPDFTSYTNEIVNNPDLITGFITSVIVSVGTMLLTLVLGVPGAYALARLKLRGS